MPGFPERVKIVEVGPRDGLQNEPRTIPTATKIEFVDRLSATGLGAIEVSSFVSPKWIPQLADAAEVYEGIDKRPGVSYSVLVPNETGMQRALEVGARHVAVFTAASETFNRKNINATIAESIRRFEPVAALAAQHAVPLRGYISCVLGCPYEGEIDVTTVTAVARELQQLGCYEISLGDTIGVGTPLAARGMVERVGEAVGIERVAIHFHDTRGQALANILACLEVGVGVVDAAVAALGGCPYADGATGNVATEDLVYMLHGMDIDTGIELDKLIATGVFVSAALGKAPGSRLGRGWTTRGHGVGGSEKYY